MTEPDAESGVRPSSPPRSGRLSPAVAIPASIVHVERPLRVDTLPTIDALLMQTSDASVDVANRARWSQLGSPT